MLILNNRHEYRPTNSTMDLLQPCEKGTRLISLENYYIEEYQVKGQLFEEQCTQEVNTLISQHRCMHPLMGPPDLMEQPTTPVHT